MCIIVYKPSGIKFPDHDTLKNCEDSNPDGMGYMYRGKHRVFIQKGFFDLNEMLDDMEDRIPDPTKTEMVIHFRIATAGRIDSGNCHPFPVTSHISQLRDTSAICKMGVAHNGIIAKYSQKEHTKKLSDTMRFLKYAAGSTVEQLQALVTPEMGKFAVMTPEGTTLIGKFINENEVYYSNDNYLPCPWLYGNYSSQQKLDRDDIITIDDLADALYNRYCLGCSLDDTNACDECWVWTELTDLYKDHFGQNAPLNGEWAEFYIANADENFKNNCYLLEDAEDINKDFAGYPKRHKDSYYEDTECY